MRGLIDFVLIGKVLLSKLLKHAGNTAAGLIQGTKIIISKFQDN